MLFTAITGFCGLYVLLKINTAKYLLKVTKIKIILAVILLVAIGVFGSYYSNFFTKKFFSGRL
jgi:hypothetical protein